MSSFYKGVCELEDAVAAGRAATVSVSCPKDVLIRAAELGLTLDYCYIDFEDMTDRRLAFGGSFENEERAIKTDAFGELEFTWAGQLRVSGFSRICEELDHDVIEAFLRAGHAAEMDPSAAIQKGRKDIVELFESYDVPLIAKTVVDGSIYVNDKGVAEFPEGIALIKSGAMSFSTKIKELRLPSTLELIATGALNCSDLKSISLPRGVKYVSVRAWADAAYGCRRVAFYDSIDYRCAKSLQRVGYKGESECVVYSTDTDKIKFMHYLNYDEMTSAMFADYNNAWSEECDFDFRLDDKWYPKMKARAKAITALNRICYPIHLDENNAKKYRAFVAKNIDTVIDHLSEFDDVDRLQALIDIGAVNAKNAGELVKRAKRGKAKKLSKALAGVLEGEPTSSGPKENKPTEEAAAQKKLTPSQAASQAFSLLGSGDVAGLELIEPIAKKITPLNKACLLEAIAVGCRPQAIRDYCKLVGKVDFTCNALAMAILSGNQENAKALIECGATLDYGNDTDMRYIAYIYKQHGGLFYKSAGRTMMPGGLYRTVMCNRKSVNLPLTGSTPAKYVSASFEERCAVMSALAQEGMFSGGELASLVIAAVYEHHFDLADKLKACAGDRLEMGAVAVRADNGFHVFKRLADLLVKDCDNVVAKYVVKNEDPEAIRGFLKENWSSTYLNGKLTLTRTLLPLLGPWNKGWGSIPLEATRQGDKKLLEGAYEADPDLIGKTALKCIEAAQKEGNTELVAWLLDKKASREASSKTKNESPVARERRKGDNGRTPSADDGHSKFYKGKSFAFGSWKKAEKDKKKPLRWLVLEEYEDGGVLALARDVVSVMPYNEGGGDVTWAECSLRKWLNGEFLEGAFDEEQRKCLRLTHVSTPDEPEYGTVGGEPADDYVFCLSEDEAYSKFAYAGARKCGSGSDGMWWLRSPGSSQDRVFVAYPDGAINDCIVEGPFNEYYGMPGARPAIIVDATKMNDIAIEQKTADVKQALGPKREHEEGPHFIEPFVRHAFRATGFDFKFSGRWSTDEDSAAICDAVDRGVPYADGHGICSPEMVMMVVCGCEATYSHDKDGVWSNDTLSRTQPRKYEWYREVWVAHESKKAAALLDRDALSEYLYELVNKAGLDAAIPALGVFATGDELESVIEIAERKNGASVKEKGSIFVLRGALLMNSADEAKEFANYAKLSKEYLKPSKHYLSLYRKRLVGKDKKWLEWS